MPGHDIIVVGVSEGGLKALKRLVSLLPEDLQAAVFIVQHISPSIHSILPSVLHGAGKLVTNHATADEPIRLGRIYVAPPDRHLLVEAGHVRLSQGPKENRFRPAIDPLFRTAAYAFGPRVVGVILTGGLNDGTAGLRAVKERGGVAIVQDPGETQNPSMPLSAMRYVDVDYCLPISKIASTLVHLTNEAVAAEGGIPVSDELELESKLTLHPEKIDFSPLKLGPPSGFTCPECHGALFRIQDGQMLRYRCHTGHGFTIETLLDALKGSVEDSLWISIRVLQETVMLLDHIAGHARESGEDELVELLLGKTEEAKQRVQLLRNMVTSERTLERREPSQLTRDRRAV